jgi:organic hydroperoxide reductase OsmC/OhrA
MTRNEAGKLWVSRIDLRPRIAYGARAASSAEEAHLHALAHEECFIAQSIRTEVRVLT